MIKFINVDGKKDKGVRLFALSTCGWCKRTKLYLEKAGIAYTYVYVDELSNEKKKEAIEMMKKYDDDISFPTIVVGDEFVIGFDKDKINKLIGGK